MQGEWLKEFAIKKGIEDIPYPILKMYFEYNEIFTKRHSDKTEEEIWSLVLNHVTEVGKGI